MAQSGKARSCELRDPWRVSKVQIPTPAFQIKEVNPKSYLRLKLPLVKMIDEPIKYKLCAANGAITERELRSFSQFRPNYFQTHYHFDTVSLSNAYFLTKEAGNVRNNMGINSCYHNRADKASFERYHKALSGYIPSATTYAGCEGLTLRLMETIFLKWAIRAGLNRTANLSIIIPLRPNHIGDYLSPSRAICVQSRNLITAYDYHV